MPSKPHSHTRLVPFLDRRILELSPRKTQAQIAVEAGFLNVNMLSMIKTGTSKLPIDRAPALASALETDLGHLLQLALEQHLGEPATRALIATFEIVSANERVWLAELREASGHTDPNLTTRLRSAFRALFGK
jgi:hypothetical protein